MAYSDPDYRGEEFGLKIVFKEERIRGTGQIRCVIVAEDIEHADSPLHNTIEASSWEQILKAYPTLKDVLENIFWSENWRADSGDGPGVRRLYIHSITGHEGLYAYDPEKSVFVEWADIVDNDIVEIDDSVPAVEENPCLAVSFDGGATWSATEKIQLKFSDATVKDLPGKKEASVDLIVGFDADSNHVQMTLVEPQTHKPVKEARVEFFDFVEIVG